MVQSKVKKQSPLAGVETVAAAILTQTVLAEFSPTFLPVKNSEEAAALTRDLYKGMLDLVRQS
jgi:hypothetical protein